MKAIGAPALAALALILAIAVLRTDLSPAAMLALIGGAPPQDFAQTLFLYAIAPRLAMAALVGLALGLAGGLMQQAAQNPLVSPITMGTASGAWLALTAAAAMVPGLAATNQLWVSLGGAATASLFVVAIAGRAGLSGLSVVLAGMAVNILLGAIATLVVLLNQERVGNLFIWGAGDLTQTDWGWAFWLAPQVALVSAAGLLLGRPLTLLTLGGEGAAARGLSVVRVQLTVWAVAVWATAAAVTAVGVIGFIGLLGPAAARLSGARGARQSLVAGALWGAVILLATDAVAAWATEGLRDLVPTGAAAALAGLPVLIWIGLTRMKAGGGAPPTVTAGRSRPPRGAWIALCLAPIVCGALALLVGRDAAGLTLAPPSALAFDLRWPRVLSALAAGAGMAAAGALLQRLLRNPLASPDIVGLSSGATLFLVAAVVLLQAPVHLAGPPAALIGAFAVLGALIMLGRRQDAQPAAVVLVGVCLAALSDALLQFALAKGGEDAYMLVGWLAGSTFRTDPAQALILTLSVAAALALAFLFRRSLMVLTLEADVAGARGLEAARARIGFLALAAALAGGVTAVVGPIAFLGLLAPHAARLLGAVRADRQLLAAGLLGAALLTLSDLAGRTALYPEQLPAGAGAAILGGLYFLALLGRRRL